MKSEITYQDSHRVFKYNKETGKLYWKVSPNRRIVVGDESGCISQKGRTSYRVIRYKGKLYKAHRIIWLMEYGEFPQPPADEIEHIDGDGLNNRIENLRAVSNSENGHNKRRQSNNKSGYTGVSWHSLTKKWRCQIHKDKKKIYLGTFNSKEEASNVVEIARKEYGLYSERHGK